MASIAAAVLDSDDYFNDITFDNAALSVVKPMLVLDSLYKPFKQREDEVGNPGAYSSLTGHHVLMWEPDARDRFVSTFNEQIDRVRHGLEKTSARINAGKLSKDKTRSLQFVPSVQLLEATLARLLQGHTADALVAMSPELLLTALSEVDMAAFWATFNVAEIPSRITCHALKAAEALAAYFSKQFAMQAGMRAHVADFRAHRAGLCKFSHPRPDLLIEAAHLDAVHLPTTPSHVYRDIVEGRFQWKEFVMDPANSLASVQQRKFDLMLLVLTGLMRVQESEPRLTIFKTGDQSLAESLVRLQTLDATADLQALSALAPMAENPDPLVLNIQAASSLCELVARLSRGEEVTAENIRACADPFSEMSLASQALC